MSTPDQIFTSFKQGLFFIIGPCVLEGQDLALEVAEAVAEVRDKCSLPVVFKSSFDKANRSSVRAFRGPGLDQGLKWLERVKRTFGLPVLTDIHGPEQAREVAEVADVLQVPAFLCRQTDLLLAAAETGRVINVKKGQFMAPWDMNNVLDKLESAGGDKVWLTERGSSFGYNNLVVDMRSISIMRNLGWPVVFDATHSVQLPGGKGACSGGQREFVPVLARAAVGAGCDGVFMEAHPRPDQALCDGPNSLLLKDLPGLIEQLIAIREAVVAGE